MGGIVFVEALEHPTKAAFADLFDFPVMLGKGGGCQRGSGDIAVGWLFFVKEHL